MSPNLRIRNTHGPHHPTGRLLYLVLLVFFEVTPAFFSSVAISS